MPTLIQTLTVQVVGILSPIPFPVQAASAAAPGEDTAKPASRPVTPPMKDPEMATVSLDSPEVVPAQPVVQQDIAEMASVSLDSPEAMASESVDMDMASISLDSPEAMASISLDSPEQASVVHVPEVVSLEEPDMGEVSLEDREAEI